MTTAPRPSVAVIGFGAMARSLQENLATRPEGPQITSCLLAPDSARSVPSEIAVHRTAGDLAASRPDLVVECAGHHALAEHVPQLLAAGVDVAIVSIGALCDDALRERLTRAAKAGGSRVIPVAGAVGGLDLLRAARLAGLDAVTYRGIKPPRAWAGSPAEEVFDAETLEAPLTFFEGTAREAAKAFPKNANVAAAIALAGMGLDATRVELVADPAARANCHQIEASGDFGSMSFAVENRPLPSNPKTSHLAALSIEAAVLEAFARADF